MFLTDNASIQEVLFFPQMKPEKKPVEITDESKGVLDILSKEEKMELGTLKEKAGLSNKKWDKSIKELTRNKLARVNKTEEGLFIEIV
jgi:lysyl-tRNA synthetase class 2